jgi:hypothetical protein
MSDYIPDADDQFNEFLPKLVQAALANAAVLKLSQADVQVLSGFPTKWNADYPAHLAAQAAAKAATATKDATRKAIDAGLRPYVAQWQANPEVTDALRALLGITIAKTTHTPAPVPSTRPELNADTSQRLQITLHFHDAGSVHKAKPAGVRGCQIWEQIGGTPPLDLTGMSFFGTVTRTPGILPFHAADAGKTVYIIARWENTTGETGPLSDVLRVVVPG